MWSRHVNLALRSVATYVRLARGTAKPFILNHLVTVRCNFACPFCYVSGPEQAPFNRDHYPKRVEMSTAQVCAFYRELVELKFGLAVILGGEPLLRTDLDELLSVLEGKVLSTLFTNGWLLSERHELVRRAGMLFVSLDAVGRRHDELRCKPGSFERALGGIEQVRRRYPRLPVCLNMTVTQKNVTEVPAVLDAARELRVPVAFQPPTFDGQFALEGRPRPAAEGTVPESGEVARAFQTIREAARTQRVIGSMAFFEHVIEDRRVYRCHYPAHVLGPVLPNGDVVACTTSGIIANVLEQPVREVLDGASWRANAEAGPACPRGCRDWGIYDLSAVRNRDHTLADARRYAAAVVPRSAPTPTSR